MATVPSNHRLAERRIIEKVHQGEWEVRNDGSIWRIKPAKSGTKRLGRVEKRMPSGYLLLQVSMQGKTVTGLAHRLVWQNFFGDIPAGMTINHKNGIKDDNRPENLCVSTYSDQAKHAHTSGLRDQSGQKNPASKLTDNQVAQIRNAYAQGGFTMENLGKKFGVKFQSISKIIRNERRKKQGGPVTNEDQRHSVSDRDPITGRFTALKQMPEVK